MQVEVDRLRDVNLLRSRPGNSRDVAQNSPVASNHVIQRVVPFHEIARVRAEPSSQIRIEYERPQQRLNRLLFQGVNRNLRDDVVRKRSK